MTGFSHGAAGISYALLRLYAATGERAYREAALDGIAYERSVFSEAEANWPDFRGAEPELPPACATQWCHGAAGIGLAGLGCVEIIDTPEIRRDIDIAVQTTRSYGLRSADHLCCGNCGRIETLLVAAQRCDCAAWREHAVRDAASIVARAHRAGAYQLFANVADRVFNPGFFTGTAGIGYELLRVADERLPSVLLWE